MVPSGGGGFRSTGVQDKGASGLLVVFQVLTQMWFHVWSSYTVLLGCPLYLCYLFHSRKCWGRPDTLGR